MKRNFHEQTVSQFLMMSFKKRNFWKVIVGMKKIDAAFRNSFNLRKLKDPQSADGITGLLSYQ